MDQQVVAWRVTRGRHVEGGAREKGHPPPELDHPGQSVARDNGLQRPVQSKAARRQPPGLEHPGDVDLRPWTGTSGADGRDSMAAPGTGGKGVLD